MPYMALMDDVTIIVWSTQKSYKKSMDVSVLPCRKKEVLSLTFSPVHYSGIQKETHEKKTSNMNV